MIYYEIRQLVKSVNGNDIKVIETYRGDDNSVENFAQQQYNSYVKDNPEAYLELIKIEHNEKCLSFTSFK